MAAETEFTQAEQNAVLGMLVQAPRVADTAINYLVNWFEISNRSNFVYARRHRVKSQESIQEKVKRKILVEKKLNYKWNDVTDIVGIRFVCLYRSDIFEVSKLVLDALLNTNLESFGNSPFVRQNLKEFRLFIANTKPDDDPLSIKIRDLAKSVRKSSDKWKYKGAEDTLKYSSIHFVTSCIFDHSAPPVPIEIQIRTVFEDAWGEVDHAALYELERAGKTEDRDFQTIEQQSIAFKKLMDSAANFADSIRQISKKSDVERQNIRIRPTIEDWKYVADVCKKISLPKLKLNELIKLIGQKEYLDSKLSCADIATNSADYVAIANKFKEFLDTEMRLGGALGGHQRGSEARQLYYVLAMEESVCRMLSGFEDQILIAAARLDDVVKEFHSHPLAWLRLGEACARLQQLESGEPTKTHWYDRGRSAFRQAEQQVNALSLLTPRARFFAASDRQSDYVRSSVGRLHAHMIWRAGKYYQKCNRMDEYLTFVKDALRVSHKSVPLISDESEKMRLLNGLIYYASEILDFSERLGMPGNLPVDLDELRVHLESLENYGDGQSGIEAIRFWDTIAYGRWMIDGETQARAAAKVVLNAHGEVVRDLTVLDSDYLREQVGNAFERALRIMGLWESKSIAKKNR